MKFISEFNHDDKKLENLFYNACKDNEMELVNKLELLIDFSINENKALKIALYYKNYLIVENLLSNNKVFNGYFPNLKNIDDVLKYAKDSGLSYLQDRIQNFVNDLEFISSKYL